MVSNLNTILTVTLFQQYTTNYYYANPYKQLSATTLNTLPQRISQVEMSLNSQLNGRLYQKYNRNNLVFNGNDKLSPADEEQTLYHCLTLCVEYNLQTGIYVNLSNSYSGNVNGTNNFSATNSNVIGMRNDIRDMLSILGLFNNAVIGQVRPKGVSDLNTINPYINTTNLHGLVRFIETYNWMLQGKITFINPDTLMIGNESFSDWVKQFIQFPYSQILSNYLTNNQSIPYMTTTQVNYWDSQLQSLSTILSNYTTQTVPLITVSDIARWNSLVTEENLSQLNQAVSTLQNTTYTQGAQIETNKQNISTNNTNLNNLTTVVDNHFEDTKNVMNILQNYENSSGTGAYTIVPLINGADIDLIFTNQQNIKNLQSNTTNLSNQVNTLSSLVNNIKNTYQQYNSVLTNYLPNTPIPIITQTWINSLNNIPSQVATNTSNIADLTNKVDNLEQNGISPSLIQQIQTNTSNISTLKTNVNNTNQNLSSLKSMVNSNSSNLSNLASILKNYTPTTQPVPLINTTDIDTWNGLSQTVSTNTQNITNNTNSLNQLQSDFTPINNGWYQLTTYVLANYFPQNGTPSTPIPAISTGDINQIYTNQSNITTNTNAIQNNTNNISNNTTSITNLQQAYTEFPTDSEWEWLNTNTSYSSTYEWVKLTTASGKTIYRMELKFALTNNSGDRFNMSNTGYVAENYSSTGTTWNVGAIIGGWYWAGNNYNMGLPSGVTVTKGITLLNYGKVYVNGGSPTNFTSATTTFLNPSSLGAFWIVGTNIVLPSYMRISATYNFGWNENDSVCINTLLYLDFQIE